jgi:hypothetical protein
MIKMAESDKRWSHLIAGGVKSKPVYEKDLAGMLT